MSAALSSNLNPLPPAVGLRIGSVQLATNLLLAPIAGYCDVSFRLVARSCGGVGLACTDLLSPEGILRGVNRSIELAATCPEDSPLAMQLYGADVDRLCEAAIWAEDRGAHVIDLNMGCPVDKVTKKNGGSKLLCDPDGTLLMVERLVKTVRNVPFTCKLRLGWDDNSIVAPYLATRLEQLGVAAITIHGRTTAMKFTGAARLDGIASVVAAVNKIPVIGNGDIKTPQDAKRMIDVTGCAGVMIARGALGAPWIFRDTWSYLTTGEVPPPLSLEQKLQLIRDHFYNLCRFRNEHTAVNEIRRRVSWYAKFMTPSRRLRQDMQRITNTAQFEEELTRFRDWRLQYDEDLRAGRAAAAEEDPELINAA